MRINDIVTITRRIAINDVQLTPFSMDSDDSNSNWSFLETSYTCIGWFLRAYIKRNEYDSLVSQPTQLSSLGHCVCFRRALGLQLLPFTVSIIYSIFENKFIIYM